VTHRLDNDAAISSLKTKLVNAISLARLDCGLFPVWEDVFKNFRAEALKSVHPWMDENDVAELLNAHLVGFLGLKVPKDNAAIAEIFSAVELEQIITRTLTDLQGIPKRYFLYFPLPGVQLNNDIFISDFVSLVKAPTAVQCSSEIAKNIRKGCFIRVRGLGYAYLDRAQSAVRDAITRLKWTCQLAGAERLFRREAQPVWKRSQVQKVHFVIICEEDNAGTSASLGLGMSRYLSEIRLTNGDWRSDEEGTLQRKIGTSLQVLEEPKFAENVQSLRRAFEWAFDASTDEEESMRFIKTCIGLEAAISEQSEEVGITEQLADRCAYLLNKTSVQRKETRDLMKKIYRLRSKIVHGVILNLSPQDRLLAENAEKMLSTVLRIELDAVLTTS
jgi:hypothetical protein